MRVYELAKELKVDSKILLAKVREIGIDAKSHMSSLDDNQADEIRKKIGKKPEKKVKATKKAQKKPSVKKILVTESAKSVVIEKHVPEKAKEEAEVSSAPQDTPKTLVEKRVSGTVIRRRKKTEPVKLPSKPETPLEVKSEEEVHVVKEEIAEDGTKKVAAEPEKEGDQKETEMQPQPQIKKIKFQGKESTPARIIDRIELPAREDRKQKVEKPEDKKSEDKKPEDKKREVSERKTGKHGKDIITPTPDTQEKVQAKEGFKRKKYRWKKDEGNFEDDTGSGTSHHKRTRYKVKEKGRKHRAEIIQFGRKKQETIKTTPKAIKRIIRVHKGITVADLSKKMGIKVSEVMKKLLDLGVMATINQVLDIDSASLVGEDFGYEIISVSIEEETIFEEQSKDLKTDLKPRCPVVTVMGHVDHGKTSLLDVIRNANVIAGEAGGITQHIGAYHVSPGNRDITFVDTPGHEAFTAMRARGAQVTDIVILVVAAEEGVKPQTVEAISHAKAANVPIIVAINKMDKPEANPDKVKQELANYDLVQEEWGGDTIFVEISAKKKQGIEKLLEMVLLQAEVLELKANPNKRAKGIIIEARIDRGRGPIATVVVQEGTLKIGDSFVSRHNSGKVRALLDDRGKIVKEAGPSTPVEILGFSGVPDSGDIFIAVDEKKARQTSAYWQLKKRDEGLRKDTKVSLENFLSTVQEKDIKELRIVIKADVQGSIEALQQSLEHLSTDEIKVNVIHSSVGAISLNDVMLASASGGIILGFGVKTEPKVFETAEMEKVDIRFYNIIYEVIDDVEKAMLGMLAPEVIEKPVGKAEIKEIFSISKYGTVAGCMVIDGKVVNGSSARVVRSSEVVHEGEITSLKRFKDDAKEVLTGQDCGIFLGSYKGFEVGDIIESFFVEEIKRTVL